MLRSLQAMARMMELTITNQIRLMNNQREKKEISVILQLEELITQVPFLSDVKLEKWSSDLASMMSREKYRPCKDGDDCHKNDCEYSHPAEVKKKKMVEMDIILGKLKERAVSELQGRPNRLAQFDFRWTLNKAPIATGNKMETVLDNEGKSVKDFKDFNDKATYDKVKNDIREDLFKQLCAALNKVTWTNFDLIVSQVGSLLDAMNNESILNDDEASNILAMVTKHTIYTEAYGQMWSQLTEVYPCLLTAEKKVLDGYLDCYATGNIEIQSRYNNQMTSVVKSKQRAALTSFLMHTMKHSAVALEREEVTQKLEYLVDKLRILREKGQCSIKHFEDISSDLIIFMREGWEVLYREEVWPEGVRQVEATIEHLLKERENGKKANIRILYAFQDLIQDMKEQGGYHTC